MSCGSTTCAEKCFSVQPRPKGPQASRCAFCRPHFASVSRVHSLARFAAGEAVKRGPMTSLKYESVCITCERFIPSSLMRSIGSVGLGCGCWPNAAYGAIRTNSRRAAANWRRIILGTPIRIDFLESWSFASRKRTGDFLELTLLRLGKLQSFKEVRRVFQYRLEIVEFFTDLPTK